MRVGAFMLEIMVETSGLLYFKNVANPTTPGKRSTMKLVMPTPETVEWLKKAHELLAAAKPFWLPLNAPPKAWRTVDDGGYWT
jgi:DNA-directed RNA polymerase